ncbi:MAG: hypothetical protein ACK5TA_01975, partial [bacterium]
MCDHPPPGGRIFWNRNPNPAREFDAASCAAWCARSLRRSSTDRASADLPSTITRWGLVAASAIAWSIASSSSLMPQL